MTSLQSPTSSTLGGVKTTPQQLRLLRVVAVFALAFLLTGCGLDSLAENAVEGAVERAIESESGEDVDLDFGSGGLSIQTEEGSLEFDAETGEFVVVDQNGEVVSGDVNLSEDGLTIESTEGSIEFDSNSGEFDVTDKDGTQVAEGVLDDSGLSANVGTDGAQSIRAGVGVSEDWPSELLAQYPGSTATETVEIQSPEGSQWILALETSDNVESVYEFYNSQTQDWSGTRTTTDDGAFLFVEDGSTAANISIAASSNGTDIGIQLAATS